MTFIDDTRRLITGGWIIGALLILAYNALCLSSLYDLYHVGYSEEVKLASSKWRQYEKRLETVEDRNADPARDLLVSAFFPNPAAPTTMVTDKPQAADSAFEKTATDLSELPTVSGILGYTDRQGHQRLLAVIEGVTYTAKSEVQGYRIEAVTEKGVTFSKSGKPHFVPGPQVYYSIDHSGSR